MASDSRSAKYVLWNNSCSFLEVVWLIVVWISGLAVGLGEKSDRRTFVFVMLCNQKEGCSLRSLGAGGGGGYLGQFLLGICRWSLRTNTFFSLLCGLL